MTRFVVALSVVAYLIGFMVAVGHYERYGVPLGALANETYLAAGIAFVVITGASILVGASLRTYLQHFRVAGWKSTFDVAWLLIPTLLLQSILVQAGWWAFVYCGAVGVAVVVKKVEARDLFPTGDLASVSWGVTRLLSIAVGLITLFGVAIFPTLSPQFGGARPKLMAAIRVDKDGGIDREHERWAKVACRDAASATRVGGEICRRIFKVYESDDHLYLLVHEHAGACISGARKMPSLMAPGACVIRVAQSSAPQIQIAD